MVSLKKRFDSLQAAAQTEKGQRAENQDAITQFDTPFGRVFLIADGMGGQKGGAEASLIVAEGFRKSLGALPGEMPTAEALQRAASETNAEMLLRSQSGDPSVAGMGSTMALVVLAEEDGEDMRCTVAHVGDSRVYLLRDGVLKQMTHDHSAVQVMVDSGQITPEEARVHPQGSVVTRAFGQEGEVEIEVSEEPLSAGDMLLLCSDGLSGYVADETIEAELFRSRAVEETAKALVAMALESGSSDNITVQVLRLGEGSHVGPPIGESIETAVGNTGSARLRTTRFAPMLRYLACVVLGLLLGFAAAVSGLGARLQMKLASPAAASLTPPCVSESTPSAERKKIPQGPGREGERR